MVTQRGTHKNTLFFTKVLRGSPGTVCEVLQTDLDRIWLIKSKKLSQNEKEANEMLNLRNQARMRVPNILENEVPVGKNDEANKEMNLHGPKIKKGEAKSHQEILEKIEGADLKRAAKIAGRRFYFLTGDLARLELALINYAVDSLYQKKYVLTIPPFFMNREAYEGVVDLDDFEDVIYKVQDEDLFLIGTSEHAIASMHTDEILDGNKLPFRYASFSPCFRKEAGAHGKDQKGIFRVHQFDKIEQFIFAKPEDSWNEHEKMISLTEEFYQKLEIPFKVMLLSSGDMGKVSSKTFDIEAWMAGQNAYREIVSCSNCLDFQSRRLKIRFRDKSNEDTEYVHTLNSTLVAVERTIVSIMENFQTSDGHIRVPEVLQKYFGEKII